MLEAYSKLKTKSKTIAEVKEALQFIWGNLPQGPIDKTVRLMLELGAGGGHFEHSHWHKILASDH